MIESLLIANRGEIARRIQRSCREMGVRAVSVYSDADASLPFVREATLALRLGSGDPQESYLDGEKLIALALGNGVQAIHPGYGFLSESAPFAERCREAGLIFVGPGPEAIRAMSDKGGAKARMQAAGVPVLPGGVAGDSAGLLALAEAAGFPVLLKAVAGGGGRGIRLVEGPADFPAALEAARREAAHHFGDDRVMVEKYLAAPRHVEIQIMADGTGQVVHLGERECSVQRRHQKLVEECPSPAVDAALRSQMTEAAIQAARAIDYAGAGTVEFLLDGEGGFYFLEMNTRLQVEHPVTEMVWGVDLVRAQIEVAGGLPLPWRQEDLVPRGHAIECRLIAEDPAQGFLPSVGPLLAFDLPALPGVRVDAGYAAGTQVSPHYDSLLGKLVTHGAGRGEALRRMERLLEQSQVAGIRTNLGFLQGVLALPAFRDGHYDTRLLEDLPASAGHQPEAGGEWLLAAGLVDLWEMRPAGNGNTEGALPRATPGPTPAAPTGVPALLARHYTLEGSERLGGAGCPVILNGQRVAGTDGGPAMQGELSWEGGSLAGLLEAVRTEGAASRGVLVIGGVRLPLRWVAMGPERWLSLRGRHQLVHAQPPRGADGGASLLEAASRLRAPLPGRVVRVHVSVGQAVQIDQLLISLEAMKVEHGITAPFAGVVRGLPFAEGAQVNRDDLLIDLEGGDAGGPDAAGAE